MKEVIRVNIAKDLALAHLLENKGWWLEKQIRPGGSKFFIILFIAIFIFIFEDD